MVGQTDGHRWGTPRPALAQTFMGHHEEVVETDHEPEPSPVADPAPGQTPGAASQRRHQAAQCAIPPFHEGCLDCRAELAYSTPKLPPIPGESCHRFHGKAATCSTRKLPLIP